MPVVRILPGNYFPHQVVQPHDIDRRCLPTAIALPGRLPDFVRHISDSCPVGRKPRILGTPHWKNIYRTAFELNRVETVAVRISFTPGMKKHAPPVRAASTSDYRCAE